MSPPHPRKGYLNATILMILLKGFMFIRQPGRSGYYIILKTKNGNILIFYPSDDIKDIRYYLCIEKRRRSKMNQRGGARGGDTSRAT